jgi:hypothetical protein
LVRTLVVRDNILDVLGPNPHTPLPFELRLTRWESRAVLLALFVDHALR